MVEFRLADTVKRRCAAYQVQDLACAKCKTIKADNASVICSKCSGPFICKENRQQFLNAYVQHVISHVENNEMNDSHFVLFSMQTFLIIAKFHTFEWLESITEWALMS